MTSVKIKFRASTMADKEGYLYYQIIHNRIIRQITLIIEYSHRNGIIIPE